MIFLLLHYKEKIFGYASIPRSLIILDCIVLYLLFNYCAPLQQFPVKKLLMHALLMQQASQHIDLFNNESYVVDFSGKRTVNPAPKIGGITRKLMTDNMNIKGQ